VAFIYNHTGTFDARKLSKPADFKISSIKEDFLFKHGHLSALHALLKHALFDPNHCHQVYLPLHFALSKRDYKMARKFLAHGAYHHIQIAKARCATSH
jgi:hypothetical protein